MKRRLVLLASLFVVLNSTGCVLADIIKIPFQILFSILGGAAGLVGLADATPTCEPPPVVRQVEGDKWLVAGLSPGAPCTITCSADGCVPRTFAWPTDFDGRGGEVVVRLDPVK